MDKTELLWMALNSDRENDRAKIAREESTLCRSMRLALIDDDSSLVRLTFINRDDITIAELLYLAEDENMIVSDEARSRLRSIGTNII